MQEAKIILRRQVHSYDSHKPWQDLKARLSPQRRVFGFFHGSMPEEPLVVLHTALMPTITATMAEIFTEEGKQPLPDYQKPHSCLTLELGV